MTRRFTIAVGHRCQRIKRGKTLQARKRAAYGESIFDWSVVATLCRRHMDIDVLSMRF